MTSSTTIAKIATSLAKAQSNIGSAHKGSANPYFKSSYADLGSIMEVVKQPLLDQGISVLQPVGHTESGLTYVETVLLHESGEFLSDKMIVTCAKDKDPQAQGSAISYARRYSLQSMLFVPSVDDDGEAAVDRSPKKKVEPKTGHFAGDSHKALMQKLAEAGRTPDDFMSAMKHEKRIPESAKDFLAMKEETAKKFLDDFNTVYDQILEWSVMEKDK